MTLHIAAPRRWLFWAVVCLQSVGWLLASPPRSSQAQSQTKKIRYSGSVSFIATKTIYIRFARHAFEAGDTVTLYRGKQKLGKWKIIATTLRTVSAQHLSGSKLVKPGDRASGRGSRVEREETASVKKSQINTTQAKQLWADVKPELGDKVTFRGSSGIPAPSDKPRTRIDYDIMLQYLGVFSRGDAFQTGVIQSRMDLSSLLGSGFWHRHLVRLRYDFASPNDPWQAKYRPNLEVYQLSAGYRFRLFDLGLGRLSNIPSEIGVVDGIKFQADPLPWLSLIAFGGLAPDERTMVPRIAGIRYGATIQINPMRWHRLSRFGFSGQIEQGQIDRHFVFAETFWTPASWLDLFARGVVEVFVPDNTFGRVAPEVTAITADAQLNPRRWLGLGLRYDAYKPALNLLWLQEWKEVLPIEGYQDYFNEELRHSGRMYLTLTHETLALRGGVSADYFYNEGHSVAATAWAHWYQIMRLPLRLYGRYTFLYNPLMQQGHQAHIRLATSVMQRLEIAAGYRIAAYLTPQDIWQLEHTIRSEVHWMLPLGFSVLLAGQFRVGDFDRGLLVYAQLRWSFRGR